MQEPKLMQRFHNNWSILIDLPSRFVDQRKVQKKCIGVNCKSAYHFER